MTCREYRDVGEKFLGEASRTEVAAVLRHVRGCPGCRSWTDARVERDLRESGPITPEQEEGIGRYVRSIRNDPDPELAR